MVYINVYFHNMTHHIFDDFTYQPVHSFLQESGVLELRPDFISVVSSGFNVFIQCSPSWIYQSRLNSVGTYEFFM